MRSQHSQTSRFSRTVGQSDSQSSQSTIGSGPRFGIALQDLDGAGLFYFICKSVCLRACDYWCFCGALTELNGSGERQLRAGAAKVAVVPASWE